MRKIGASVLVVTVVALLFVRGGSADDVAYGHTLGGPGTEHGIAVGMDESGNIYQLGVTFAHPARAFLAKWDARGDVLWQRILDFGQALNPTGMDVLPDGTVYFAGRFENDPAAATIIGKVLSDGTLAFSKVTDALYIPVSLTRDPAFGGVVVTGLARRGALTGGIIAVGPAGEFRWGASVDAPTIPYAATVDRNGTVFVAATHFDAGRQDAGIVAFNASGAFLRELRLDLGGDEYGVSLTLGPDGGLYLLGFTFPYPSGADCLFARFTPSLDPQWTEAVGSPSLFDYASRIISRGDGTFQVHGSYSDTSTGDYGSLTYRLDSSGAILGGGALPSSGPGGFYGGINDVAVGPDGTVLLTGSSYRSPPRSSTPIEDARTVLVNQSWVPDPSGWRSMSASVSDQSGTLIDAKLPVDDFRVQAGYQAWYGAIEVPASAVKVVVSATVTDRDSRTVALTANVTGGTPPYTYRWSFGDGNASTDANPTHIYGGSGRYPVQVAVEDSGGNRAHSIVEVLLPGPPAITAVSISPDPTHVGQFTHFNAAGDDPDGSIVSWHWDFGDGFAGDARYPRTLHIYRTSGTYNVTVTARDNDGLEASASRHLEVIDGPPGPPSAVLVYTPSRPFVDDAVYFDGSLSDDPDGVIVRHVWHLGDGTEREGARITHRYAYPGTYVVQLTVVDEDGFAATSSSNITVASRPVAAFTVSPRTPRALEDVIFTANGSSDLTNSLVYRWDFGDGTHGEGWQTTKQYRAPGTYRVTLRVTNPFGVSAIATMDVVVESGSPAVAGSGLPNETVLVSLLVVAAATVAIGVYVARRSRSPKPPSALP